MPEIGSRPMVASIKPMPPETMPLSTSSPLSAATKEIPSSESMKNSGEPKESTSGRMIGMATRQGRRRRIWRRPGNSSAPRQERGPPRRCAPWRGRRQWSMPSSVRRERRTSTEVMSPVVAVTAVMPRRNAKASTADILKTNGSISAIAVGPPSPGRMPTTKPMAMPTIIRLKVDKLKHWRKPEIRACNMSMKI